ncbi:expressed unknown protein [Seminavis robusta]|uniref:Uncharacterized protein n=1 Tax=Seminavis robusta TaxID=568900 RepID=A0A9N8HYW9_9STRA|nr:expressed unknown protein [Seminavis robusta]|eukprot:Sro2105_g314760.1 n/a (330) ;mRNA; f:10299-11288
MSIQSDISFDLFLNQMHDSMSSLGSDVTFEDDVEEDVSPSQRRLSHANIQVPRTPLQKQRSVRRPNTCGAVDRQRCFGSKPRPQLETRGDIATKSLRHLLDTSMHKEQRRSMRGNFNLDGSNHMDKSVHSQSLRRKVLPRQMERLSKMAASCDTDTTADCSMRWAATSVRTAGDLAAADDSTTAPRAPQRQNSREVETVVRKSPVPTPKKRQLPRRVRTLDGSGHSATVGVAAPFMKRLPPRKSSNGTAATAASSFCGSLATSRSFGEERDVVAPLKLPALLAKKPDVLRKPVRQVSTGEAPKMPSFTMLKKPVRQVSTGQSPVVPILA